MAAYRAIGYDNDQIIETTTSFLSQKAFDKVDYRTLLNIAGLPLGKFGLNRGLLKQKLGLEMCRKVFGGHQLETLPSNLILQATDIQNGQGVVLEQGSLAEAVYASAAMYPLLPPLKIGERWLADGAFSSPLPVLEAVKRGMDIIIVMAFNEDLIQEPTRFLEGFSNILSAFSRSLIQSQLSLAIDLHHYEVIVIKVPFEKPISYSDASQIPHLVELGHSAVEPKKQEILDAIRHFS